MRISLLISAVVAATLFVKPAQAAVYASAPMAASEGLTYDGGTITTTAGFLGPVTNTSFLSSWSLSFSNASTSFTLNETNSTATYLDDTGNNLVVTPTTIEWPQPVGGDLEDLLIFSTESAEIFFLGGDTGFTETDIFLADNNSNLIGSTGSRPIVATLVPEPTSALFLCGSGALVCLRRRRRKQPA